MQWRSVLSSHEKPFWGNCLFLFSCFFSRDQVCTFLLKNKTWKVSSTKKYPAEKRHFFAETFFSCKDASFDKVWIELPVDPKKLFLPKNFVPQKSHKIEKLRLSIKFYTKKTSANCSSENFSSILLSFRKWWILYWIPLRSTVVRYYLNSFCSLKFWLSLAILWIF